VRLHTQLMGGPFDGQMITLSVGAPKDNIRVAVSEDITEHDVNVEQYALIEALPFTYGGNQWMASYRWVGARKSSIHLVDAFVEAE
jgi:hypothetical protein